MAQRVPPLPLRPLKVFLVVGILLLIVSLFLFYFASIIGFDYVTATYKNEVNLAFPNESLDNLGYWPYGYICITHVTMQPYEILTVSHPKNIQLNGTVQIEIVDARGFNVLYVSGVPDYSHVSYENEAVPNLRTTVIVVAVYLFAQYKQNVTLSTVTSTSHSQPPQWVYLGVGTVFLALAVFVTNTYRTKKQNTKPA